MTEAEFTREVIDIARERGLLAHHCAHAALCDGAGFPDLVIIGPGGILFAELKAHTMARSPSAQTDWRHALRAGGTACYLWTPTDLPWIKGLLSEIADLAEPHQCAA